MKKLTVILMVLSLTMGCAMFQTAQNTLCNPTATQKADAQLAINAIDSLLAFFSAMPTPIQPEIVAAAAGLKLAEPYFGMVVAGTCVVLTDLENAYNVLANANQVAAAKAAQKGLKAASTQGMFPIPPAFAFGFK